MKRSALILLSILLVLGGAIRFYQIGSESIWMDEAYALREAGNRDLTSVLEAVSGPPEGTPPLYFLFLHSWISIFGTSDVALRVPSAIFSTLAIIAIFFLGKEVKDERTGLVSAALLSLSMTHLVYAQEARPYGLFTFLLILSLYFYARLIKGKGGAVGYLLTTLLMLYTHYLSFFILLFQLILYFFLERKIPFSRWISIQAITAFLFLPGIFILFRQFHGLNETIQVSLGQKLGLPSFVASLGVFNFIFPALIGAVVLFYIWKKKVDITKIKVPERLAYWICLLAMVIALLLHRDFTGSTFITRYTHFFFPVIYILAALAVSEMRPSRSRFLGICFIIIAIMSIFAFHSSFPRKIQWKEAVEFLEDRNNGDEPVVVINAIQHEIYLHYRSSAVESHTVMLHTTPEENEEELEALIGQIGDPPSLWLIWPEEYKTDGLYQEYFGSRYILDLSKKYKGIEIYHFVRFNNSDSNWGPSFTEADHSIPGTDLRLNSIDR